MNSFNPELFRWDSAEIYKWRCFDRITVATVTWNRLDHTRTFLDSHFRSAVVPHEVLVVDNGSTDGTVPFLRDYAAEHPSMRVIENGRNVGKSRAQLQIQDAVTDGLVILMDNDVRLLSSFWLVHLLKAYHAYRVVHGTLDVAFGVRLLNCEEYGFRYGEGREILRVPHAENSPPRTSYAASSKDGSPDRLLDEEVVIALTGHIIGPCTAMPVSVLRQIRLGDAYPRPIGGADVFISGELARLGIPMAYIENGPVGRHEDWPYTQEKVALYGALMKTRAVTDFSYIKWKLRRLLFR